MYFGEAFERAVGHQTAFLSRCLDVASPAKSPPATELPRTTEVML